MPPGTVREAVEGVLVKCIHRSIWKWWRHATGPQSIGRRPSVSGSRPEKIQHAVLEGNFYPSAATRLRHLDEAAVEVFCRCPLNVCRDRFERRLREGGRHGVHPAEVPTLEFFTQFAEPIRIGPVLEVDTETHPDVPTIVAWINANR